MANASTYWSHPFDSNKKVYTDPESISLLLRLWNVFVIERSKPEPIFDDSDWGPPIGMREQSGFALPAIQIIVPEAEFHAAVDKLVRNDDVVAIFYHSALDRQLQEGRMIYGIMKSRDAAYRFAGIVNAKG